MKLLKDPRDAGPHRAHARDRQAAAQLNSEAKPCKTYKAPLRDMRFVLHEMYGTEELTRDLGFEDASDDLCDTILEEAAKVAEEVLLPINASGDLEGCHYENGVVRTPKGFREAYNLFRDGGWTSLNATRSTAARACRSPSPSRSRRCSARPTCRLAFTRA